MKKILTLAVAMIIAGCGGEDRTSAAGNQTGGNTSEYNSPKVLSTTPPNGAVDISVGEVNITIVFDQKVLLSSNNTSAIQISGASVKGIKKASDNNILLVTSCPEYGTPVRITLPTGLVTNATGQQSESYQFGFTTAKEPTSLIPVTPITASTESAKKLYRYLLEQYGKKTISSVMANVNWNTDCAEKVYKLTGKYPAMNCYDFIHICYSASNSWINYDDITPVQQWYTARGLVQLMWHFNVPIRENSTEYSFYSNNNFFKPSRALTSGTWENKWFYEQMDKVVDIILKLQDAGIAATWRPFHEAAGNAIAKQQANWTKAWFWWGAEGAYPYKQLWIAMYDYFKQKGVNNLIWVWTTQNYNGNSSQYNQDTAWYPGDQYVDIVARDLYGGNADQNLQEFNEIQAAYPNKMVALGECGHGDSGDPAKMSDVWAKGAKWSHFMVWCQSEQGTTDTMCSDAWWKDAMKEPNVITRDQVPDLQ